MKNYLSKDGLAYLLSKIKAEFKKYLPLSGGTMTGELKMGSNKLSGLPTPTADTEAATKSYVDTHSAAAPKLDHTFNANFTGAVEGKLSTNFETDQTVNLNISGRTFRFEEVGTTDKWTQVCDVTTTPNTANCSIEIQLMLTNTNLDKEQPISILTVAARKTQGTNKVDVYATFNRLPDPYKFEDFKAVGKFGDDNRFSVRLYINPKRNWIYYVFRLLSYDIDGSGTFTFAPSATLNANSPTSSLPEDYIVKVTPSLYNDLHPQPVYKLTPIFSYDSGNIESYYKLASLSSIIPKNSGYSCLLDVNVLSAAVIKPIGHTILSVSIIQQTAETTFSVSFKQLLSDVTRLVDSYYIVYKQSTNGINADLWAKIGNYRDVEITVIRETVTRVNTANSHFIWESSPTPVDKLPSDGVTVEATPIPLQNSAASLTTPRNISLTGAVTGSQKFDGSADIAIDTSRREYMVGRTSINGETWYKMAETTLGEYSDPFFIAEIRSGFAISQSGVKTYTLTALLQCHFRTSPGVSYDPNRSNVSFIYATKDFDISNVKVLTKSTSSNVTIQVYIKRPLNDSFYSFYVRSYGKRNTVNTSWTFYDDEIVNSLPSDMQEFPVDYYPVRMNVTLPDVLSEITKVGQTQTETSLQIPKLTIGLDGRVTSAADSTILLPEPYEGPWIETYQVNIIQNLTWLQHAEAITGYTSRNLFQVQDDAEPFFFKGDTPSWTQNDTVIFKPIEGDSPTVIWSTYTHLSVSLPSNFDGTRMTVDNNTSLYQPDNTCSIYVATSTKPTDNPTLCFKLIIFRKSKMVG